MNFVLLLLDSPLFGLAFFFSFALPLISFAYINVFLYIVCFFFGFRMYVFSVFFFFRFLFFFLAQAFLDLFVKILTVASVFLSFFLSEQ